MGTKMRMTVEVFFNVMNVIREWGKMLKGNTHQYRILYSVKVSFNNKGKVKT